ncbi:DNA topoisomerase IV subunit B [Tichowtungia aerotolerans]|uniref:DNA topoisomerase (ATP-hydrolyzing) n=1 Tax=Tichowtungia aerotolerans TaxID=2697043 RepID=A0A6P1ME04_9BACT|nr:DNA topoisomerase IV subunit B [Tichowtungia aerotolerans]QHI70298.1 type IIA DNA topoisomerase subunit B [Tichowtungia aerotolerans]
MADNKKKHVYDESKIKTLSSLEHIRARTGMYIGRTGNGNHYDDGIYVLLKEVIDNAIDEFIMGHGKKVEITLEEDTVSVRDYGRGIPLGKLVECVSRINTGAKYNDDVFQFSVGLNGVGTKAVNALSTYFVARAHRDGKFAEARFVRGILDGEDQGSAKNEENGTYISFSPDPEIFRNFKFREDHINRRLRFYSYLNAGLVIVFNGKRVVSQGGLLDLIRDESEFEKIYPPFHYRDKMLEFAFTHTNRFSEDYYSFVNGQFTSDGGTHLSAFREGLLKGINEYASAKFDGNDVREGILGAVAIRLKEPIFESQTKNKLGNTEIRSDIVASVKKAVVELLHRNKPSAEKLIDKIKESQKLRKELNSVKKLARERSKAVSIRVPQLKDCKKHFNKSKGNHDDTMIFITEGQSAAGSLVSCRDVNTQAIYTLKGKPLNVWDLKRDAIYKNVEIYNLMRSLNIEEDSNCLRYNHVVLATDADVDGLHIRNLMITFFLRFFESVVRDGHLQILETPLFRVRNKKDTLYCYSEAERDSAMKKLGRSAEVTRFKGLGEISPKEFGAFIGQDMRLTPVVVDEDHSISEVLSFYMGKNTQERRSYIMDNLVVDEEIL